MISGEDSIDRADPGARALARLEDLRARDTGRRIAAATALVALGIALVFAAAPVTGDSGATVGAVVAVLLALAIASAIWPTEWTPAELEHHRLDSIWREARPDPEREVPWERYVAWAHSACDSVVIGLLCRVPRERRVAGAPSPYLWEERQRLAADDVASAAEAMEALRDAASELELAARRRWEEARTEAERRAHEQRLAYIDREAQAEAQAHDEALRREMAAQEAAERRAQAEAVARALRRP